MCEHAADWLRWCCCLLRVLSDGHCDHTHELVPVPVSVLPVGVFEPVHVDEQLLALANRQTLASDVDMCMVLLLH
jgi:hypothetical protein